MIRLAGVFYRREDTSDLQIRRFFEKLIDLLLDAVEHRDIRCAPGFKDTECRCDSTVETSQRALLANIVTNLGDILKSYVRAIGQANLRVSEIQSRRCRAEHANRLLATADLRTTTRRIQIKRA